MIDLGPVLACVQTPPPPVRKPSPNFPEARGERSVYRLALSTRTRFRFKKDISFSGLAYRPHVSSEMVTENAGFSLTCRRTKVEVFEYDDVIHDKLLMTHAPKGMLSYLRCFSVSVWTGP